MPTLLHAGCGDTPRPAWAVGFDEVRLDIDRRCNPDIVANITSLGDIGPFDALYSSHCLEHLYPHQVPVALAEFLRVLKPGGVLLFAESTKRYIHSWIIRALFRHPMEVQRTAEEYLAMVRAAGFVVPESSISYPYLWWSRGDLGILERWFGVAPRKDREETLLNLVAVKPRT
jgi:SAM-dependent methyltransferase